MVVDAGDTGVLLYLFLANVASLWHEEEKPLTPWSYFRKVQHVILPENTRTPIILYLRRLPVRRD